MRRSSRNQKKSAIIQMPHVLAEGENNGSAHQEQQEWQDLGGRNDY